MQSLVLFLFLVLGALSKPVQIEFNGLEFTVDEVSKEQSAHFMKGAMLYNQAQDLEEQGRYRKALRKYQESLSYKVEAFGKESKHAVITRSSISDILLKMDRLEEARKELDAVFDLAERLDEPDRKEQLQVAQRILKDLERAIFEKVVAKGFA